MSKCIFNRLVVEGDKARLDVFRKSVEFKFCDNGKAAERCFGFESVVPLPHSEICELNGLPTSENKIREICWGCDCEAILPTVSEISESNRLEYSFRTVLREPTKVCAALLKRFPDLKIAWFTCDEDDYAPEWDALQVQPWSDLTAYVKSRISDFEQVL